jgi:hypothetical protein
MSFSQASNSWKDSAVRATFRSTNSRIPRKRHDTYILLGVKITISQDAPAAVHRLIHCFGDFACTESEQRIDPINTRKLPPNHHLPCDESFLDEDFWAQHTQTHMHLKKARGYVHPSTHSPPLNPCVSFCCHVSCDVCCHFCGVSSCRSNAYVYACDEQNRRLRTIHCYWSYC